MPSNSKNNKTSNNNNGMPGPSTSKEPTPPPVGGRTVWRWYCYRCNRSFPMAVTSRCLACDVPFSRAHCRTVRYHVHADGRISNVRWSDEGTGVFDKTRSASEEAALEALERALLATLTEAVEEQEVEGKGKGKMVWKDEYDDGYDADDEKGV